MNREATIPRLHFFPTGLPDETLHSRVSRLHTLSGNLDDRHTLQDTFGSHTLVATSHLPSHLNALVSRLPDGVYGSAKDFIEQATLFPYFRPFLQPAQVERCHTAMCGNNAGDVKVGIGLVASRIGGRNAFRFCRQCRIKDAAQHGVAYWHRAHQLPGVWICVAHDEPLIEVHASWLCSHRHNLFLPMPERFRGSLSERSIGAIHAACLYKCAALSTELLVGAQQSPLDSGALRSFYRDCAVQQGWIDANGRISTMAVRRSSMEFCAKWPPEQNFQFLRDEQWIFKLLHKHRSSMHPLKHVAMLILLGSDWHSLLAYCLDHHARPPPAPSQPGRFCYPSNADSPLDIPRTTRPKTLKGEKLNQLRLALAAADPLQQITQNHSISLPSLYRILRREPNVAAARSERFRDARRERFIDELRSKHPRSAQDYMWLYRNDRAWLKQRISQQLPRTGKSPQWRVDWNKRDTILAKAVQHQAMAFCAAVPPIRVTKTLIARSTGKQATIEKYASRLPLTMAALAEETESVEHFQCRRLKWASRELIACGQPLQPWQILRIAGLAFPLSPALEKALAELAEP